MSRICSTSLGMIGRRFYTGFLDLSEHAHEIAAEDLFDVGVGEAALQQPLRDSWQAGSRLEVLGQRWNAVEIAADADVIDARDFGGVDEVIDDVLELRGRASQ